jgi:hypothetical protein
MTTPKKRRLREQPDPDDPSVVLDKEFDEVDQANAEWAAWKWPSEHRE